MRINLLALALLAGSALAPVAHAVDGTINFTGTILDAACTVDPGSASQTVNIGTVNKTAFKAAGDTASNQAFKITIGECDPAITRAAVRFDGPTAAGDNRLLALSTGTTATGVGVAIFESDSATLVPMGTKSVGLAAPADGESADLNFVAKYMSTTAPAGINGGAGAAVATFTMDYN